MCSYNKNKKISACVRISVQSTYVREGGRWCQLEEGCQRQRPEAVILAHVEWAQNHTHIYMYRIVSLYSLLYQWGEDCMGAT